MGTTRKTISDQSFAIPRIPESTYPQPAYPLCVACGLFCPQNYPQVLIILADALLGHAQLADARAGMEHCRVIAAAKGVADFRKAVRGEFFRERHRDLPWSRDGTAAAF